MSAHRDLDRMIQSFLAEGPMELPDPSYDEVRDRMEQKRQRAFIGPWRTPDVNRYLQIGLAAAAVVVVAVIGIQLFGGGNIGGPPDPTPSPSDAAPSAPTVPPEIDTSSWNTFTSVVYGFTVGYPADWRLERRATRPWAPGDGLDFSSPGVETFTSPEGDLAVSVWGVAVDPSPNPTTASSWEDFEAWIESLCTLTKNGPCTGIHDRVVPMCPDGDTECHTGAMIVPFTDNVAGFKGGDRGGITIVVDGAEVTYWVIVSVWQPESFPGLARYGGGTRLIQAFLESMGAQMPSRGPVDHSNHP